MVWFILAHIFRIMVAIVSIRNLSGLEKDLEDTGVAPTIGNPAAKIQSTSKTDPDRKDDSSHSG